MKKIESLTDGQQKAMLEYRAKWLAIGRSTEPADRACAENAVTEMYRLLGKPKPRFWWSDGPAVGSIVRALISSKKLANLGANLGDNLWDNLGANLWANLRANLGANLGDNLRDNLGANLRANLRDNLGANLRANLRDNLGANLGANLGDNLWANLGANLWDSLNWGFGGSASYETAWSAFYAFPDLVLRSMHTNEQRTKLNLWLSLSESTGWWHPFENIAFMCERPKIQLVDENGSLHADGGPALLCRDSFPVYALHGVRMKPEYILTSAEKLDATEILKETNTDVRRELIRKVGVEMLLSHLPHTVMDKRDSYELLKIDFPGLIENTRFLKMVNPSIGVFHLEGVERECDTVEHAINWRAGKFSENKTWAPNQLT